MKDETKPIIFAQTDAYAIEQVTETCGRRKGESSYVARMKDTGNKSSRFAFATQAIIFAEQNKGKTLWNAPIVEGSQNWDPQDVGRLYENGRYSGD